VSLFRRRSASAPNEHQEGGQAPDTVIGERGIASVNRPPSLQSRISNLLAFGLMSTLAIGFMGWYYGHAIANRKAAKSGEQTASQNKAQGEMTLPPLGRVDPPKSLNRSATAPSAIETGLGPAPPEPFAGNPPPATNGFPGTGQPPYNTYGAAQPPPKTSEQLALERRLSGPVFAGPSGAATSAMAMPTSAADGETRPIPAAATSPRSEGGDLGTMLKSSVSPATQAQVIPTQRLLLPKGAFLDCTLETAIDSTLPGMTTCVLATDTFSVDGSVVLLERGTKLVGETRGQVQQGSSRIFVLWTEARTPTGVIVPLASPGTDELGRSGLAGQVDRHFWDRFGAAILVSVIEGGMQAAVQSRNNGGTVIYNPTTTTDVTTEVLKSTISIPPTVTKANGDRIQVLVARDLDFRSVYELRPVATGR
jgi:type IV secretion system protein VirB10